VLGRPITIYGDGRQVRDVLHVRDLLAAYEAAIESIEQAAGTAYNVGGGPDNTLSLLELIAGLEARLGRPIRLQFDGWRPGDQRVYISDIGRIRAELGWRPTVAAGRGLDRLVAWVEANRELLSEGLDQG
jgi:CDP-paratose 2-epimerase